MLKVDTSGQVAIISLQRPPANALNNEFVSVFDDALDAVERSNARALIVRSALTSIFCSGADIGYIEACIEEGATGRGTMLSFVRRLQATLRRIEASPIPSIAVIDGTAVGGGLELALACDIRVCSASARVGLPEAKIGLLPGAGGTQRLTRVAGSGVAALLILGAQLVRAEEAKSLGIVQIVERSADIDEVALTLARSITSLSPLAVVRAKQCIAAAPSEAGYALELEATAELLEQDLTRQMISDFLSSRYKERT